MLSLLRWIQTVSALGSLGQMVGVPIACRPPSARDRPSYLDQLKLFSHRTRLFPMLRSGRSCVAIGPGWRLLAGRWLCRPLGGHLNLASCVGWSWFVLSRKPHVATFVFFHLDKYFSSKGSPWMQLIIALGVVEVLGTWMAKSRAISLCSPTVRTYYFRCPTLIRLSTK